MGITFLSLPPKSQKKPREMEEDRTEKRKRNPGKGEKVAVSTSVSSLLFSHVCVCSYVCTHMNAHVVVKPEASVRYPPLYSPLYSLRQALSLTLELMDGETGQLASTCILLPPHPQHWNYRWVLLHPAFLCRYPGI